MNKAVKDILDYRFLRGLVFGCVLGVLLGVMCSCQPVEGPAGKDGVTPKYETNGSEYRWAYRDSVTNWHPFPVEYIFKIDTLVLSRKDTLVISHKDTVLHLQVDTVYAIQLDTVEIIHETIIHVPADTVYVNLSDSTMAPQGLMIGQTKLICSDTCTVYWHHTYTTLTGNPIDSLLFRVVLIKDDGITKIIQPDTPFLPKTTGVIKYLCTGIGLGQWTVWVRACRKNSEGTWLWSTWYTSSSDNTYIRRIVTPE